MFIGSTYMPKIRQDVETLRLLDTEFGHLNAEGHEGVYIVASSEILNSDIIYKLNAPSFDKDYQLISVPQVDLRDGFNVEFFDADIVVICDPLQIHLPEEGQRVISLLYALYRGGDNSFHQKYALHSEYELDGGVTAYVYVKQQELTESDIRLVREMYERYYSDYPELFRNRIDEYISLHFGGGNQI